MELTDSEDRVRDVSKDEAITISRAENISVVELKNHIAAHRLGIVLKVRLNSCIPAPVEARQCDILTAHIVHDEARCGADWRVHGSSGPGDPKIGEIRMGLVYWQPSSARAQIPLAHCHSAAR